MGGDRNRRTTRLPLALVVLALVSALAVPLAFRVRNSLERREIEEVLSPAAASNAEIQLSVALEVAYTRAYVLTSDPWYASAYRATRERQAREADELVRLMRRTGAEEHAEALRIRALVRQVEGAVDSLYVGLLSPGDYLARIPAQQARLGALVESATELSHMIAARVARHRARIVWLERVSLGITALLVLLALAATLQVARLARDYGALADRLDERAQRQMDLRETAAALNAAVTGFQAAETIARHAVRSTRAFGAYVERAATPEPGADVEVIGVSGDGTPPLGTRVPYPDSLTEAITDSGEPHLLHEIAAVGERLAPYLIERCHGCTGLVAPITFGDEAVGALVLLRSPEQVPFSREEATYVAVLADLASTTLRRVALVVAVRESEERFRQIADHLREAIWLSDPDFRELHYANPAYERIWGRGPDGRLLLLRDRLDTVHPEDRAAVDAALRSLPTSEYELEYRLIGPDGQLRWVRSRGYPIRNERGVVYRVAGITEDITDRKRAEQERERLLRQAQEARTEAERRRDELQRVTESRNRLMRGFGHDVKNPLGAADGYLQLMEEGVVGDLSEKQEESVASARRSIGAAIDLIDQLLELARAEATEIELQTEPVDLRDLVRDAAGEYRARAKSQGLSLSTEIDDDVPVIDSDASRIHQIIGNLLTNAVKYTEHGSVTVRVEPREGAGAPGPGRWVAIDVADTGPGIPEEQQRRLFREFSRLGEFGKEGAGIGLAISRRLAHALGGELTVESTVGEGSTFTLWLPAGAAGEREEAPRQAAD